MEEALEQASLELGIPVRRLECEILERGNSGLWGVGKKSWRLKVYEKSSKDVGYLISCSLRLAEL